MLCAMMSVMEAPSDSVPHSKHTVIMVGLKKKKKTCKIRAEEASEGGQGQKTEPQNGEKQEE